jgi:hypothetical protein
MIWINPVTGNHNTWHFFSGLRAARQNAPILRRVNRDSYSSTTRPPAVDRFGTWQNPPGLPYGDVALQ